MDLKLRPWTERDCVDALTALLHRAYAGLGAMGLNYTAVDQSVETTGRRIAAGECHVAERAGAIVGTVTVKAPHDVARERGYRWLALDTAVPATHLRALYSRLGFRDVDQVQWEGKRYRSTIMAKEL